MTARLPPHIPLRDRIDLIELESRLNDARKAIRIADHFAIEEGGQELTAYAVQRAAHEIEAALAAFSGRAA